MRRWMVAALAVVCVVSWTTAVASAADTTAVAGTVSTGDLVVRADGAVSVSPGTAFRGDARRVPLAQPITGIAATATLGGYWLVAADGGVFSYGDARFYGSMVGTHLNAPVVGIASTEDGHGYWLVAADGGVFSFGDARFFGSLAGHRLAQPVVGITTTQSGNGYRLLARDGGVFTFGDATFWGSLGGTGLTDVIGLAPTPSGNGYWILRTHGTRYQYSACLACSRSPVVDGPSVLNFGDAQRLTPIFEVPGPCGPCARYDLDFVHDPVVAIVPNPSEQGYVLLRPNIALSGWAGHPSF